jgi:hypothetical protein
MARRPYSLRKPLQFRCDELPGFHAGLVPLRRCPMYFVAGALVLLSGLFYAAGHHELGRFSADVCRYGSTFCESPFYLLVGAGLAAIWGTFVTIR